MKFRMSEIDDIDVYTQKLDPGIYVTLIGDESNEDLAKRGKNYRERNVEPYVWVATGESLGNLLKIFKLEPMIIYNYIDRENFIHFDFLYKEVGRSGCYAMVKTIYDPISLDFGSDGKKITEIEKSMKVEKTRFKNVKSKKGNYYEHDGPFLSGLKIGSFELISPNGEAEKLEFCQLKPLVKWVGKENLMSDMDKFIQKVLDGIAEDNSQRRIHDEAVKYMYG